MSKNLTDLIDLIATNVANSTDTVVPQDFAAHSGFDIKFALDEDHEVPALLVLCPVLDDMDQFNWAVEPLLEMAREDQDAKQYLILDSYDRMHPTLLSQLRTAVDKSAANAMIPDNVHLIWQPNLP